MGKNNNLVERQTFSSEFYLPKRSSIYGFSICRSLSLFRGGRTSPSPPSGSATGYEPEDARIDAHVRNMF